jgi:hypothetical protein
LFFIGLPLHGVLVYFLTTIDFHIKYIIVVGNPGDSHEEIISFLSVNLDLGGKLRIYDTSVCIKLMAGFLMSWSSYGLRKETFQLFSSI